MLESKKGEGNQMVTIILLTMVFIICISLLINVANTTSQSTQKQQTVNQSVNIAAAHTNSNTVNTGVNFTVYSQAAWKQIECPISSVVIGNASGGSNWTRDTDYTLFPENATFSLLNTTKTVPRTTNNLSYAYYMYCGDNYMTGSGDRSLFDLIKTLGIIALLALGALVAYKQFKN